MQKLFKKIKSKIQIINRVSMFMLAVVFIVYIFPRQGKFQYEYELGAPWKHEDLIADSDFPIRKSETELSRERDSILTQYMPYFNFQIEVGLNQIKTFKSQFTEEWNEYSLSMLKGISEQEFISNRNYVAYNQLRNEYSDFISDILLKIYDKGIIDIPEHIEVDDDLSVVIVKFNIAEEENINEVFTSVSAYQYLANNLDKKLLSESSRLADKYLPFFESLALDRYIVMNLFYDEVRSQEYRQSILDKVSEFKGKFKEGQLVIERGDMVTQNKFKIIESYRKHYEAEIGQRTNYYMILLGKIVLVLSCFVVLFLFLYNFRKEILLNFNKTAYLIFLMVAMIGASRAIHFFDQFNLYLLPFALLPILVRTFFDARLALFTHFITILLVGFYVPNGFEFIFLNFIAGNVAIFTLTNSNRRRKIVSTAILVFFSYSFTYLGFLITRQGLLKPDDFRYLGFFALNASFLFTAFPLIYIFEKTFGFVSDATLLELADTNQPLLRKLAEKAPGTFQHSLQVANIAEEAIFKIGGNPLLVRTGALYHDIGKMDNPIYFIENQSGGINPHADLDFAESARIIIDHVTKGILIARKNKLPEIIIDFIRTHHGTSTVQYFYRNYLKMNPEKKVRIEEFTYPGPKPYSKETAVLMMADSVEAASRSLKDINNETINDLVDNIINYQQVEEQFNNADITYRDISEVKVIFKKRLREIYHARISYPKAD